MKNKISEYLRDKKRRFYMISALSFVFNFAFLIYNFVLGIHFSLVWNFSVSFYYLALLLSKGEIIIRGSKDGGKTERKRFYANIESCFLMLLDIVLIAPIVLILFEQRAVNLGTIPAITTAAYTTVKVTLAIVNYTKARKHGNPSYELLRLIGIKEAVVSVITLQNTLIVTFGDAREMFILSTVTSGIFLIFLVLISFLYLYKINRKNV